MTILYAIGWLITALLCACLYVDGDSDAYDWLAAAIFGAFLGLFWPVAIPVATVGGLAYLAHKWRATQRDAAERRELDRHERQARIQQLERELGIGDSQ